MFVKRLNSFLRQRRPKGDFDGEVVRVVVPGTMGMFEILEHHAPIISSLTAGVVSYLSDKQELSEQPVAGGFVEVQKDEVRLCVELS